MKSLRDHLAYIRAHPDEYGSLLNTMDDMLVTDEVPERTKSGIRDVKTAFRDELMTNDVRELRDARTYLIRTLEDLLGEAAPLRRAPRIEIPPYRPLGNDFAGPDLEGGRRRTSQTKRFGRCVKAVRKTVKARKGSNPDSAAIAICTTTLLHPRGRTIKRYRKGRLLTQRRH